MPDFHLPDADGYLVALSGGADSRLLLELTVRAALLRRPERPVGDRVTAVHLHHGIRGAEADRDEAFCRSVCATLGVPLVVEHADIPARAAASGRSMETEAREARYALFRSVMVERGISVLLTAHHADDRLETVLHHLLRGTGTRGMGGIPPMRFLDDEKSVDAHVLFRPLLDWTRRDILAACAELGLDYVTDSTNLVADGTRNRLRLTVIPALEAIAGEGVPQRAVGRLATAAREDDEALCAIARARFEAAMQGASADTPPLAAAWATATGMGSLATEPTASTGRVGLPAAAVRAEPAAIAKRMIGLAYAAYYRQSGENHRARDRGSTAENRGSTVSVFDKKTENPAISPDHTLSAHHLEALLALCHEGREGTVSDRLPGDVRAAIEGGRLVFGHPTSSTLTPPTDAERTAESGNIPRPASRPLTEGVTVWSEARTGQEADFACPPTVTVEVARVTLPAALDTGDDVWASAIFPAAPLPRPLLLRYRKAGDVILSHGMHKKIKKLLCDKHIPPRMREWLPLICLPDGAPLWVPGVAFRDGYPTPEAGDGLRITVRVNRHAP